MLGFLNSNEEVMLIKFIAKFQYLPVNDAKYFFKTQKYYRQRITNLVKKRYLKRLKLCLVLDKAGIEYAKLFNFEYNKLNTNIKYRKRFLRISNIGLYYLNSENVKFTPSYQLKEHNNFYNKNRRFIGLLEIFGTNYLTYQIDKEHDHKYIMSVVNDIYKEQYYKNFIVLVDDINKVDLEDLSCGHYNTIVIEDNPLNMEKLKYMNSVRWEKIIHDYFPGSFLSGYYFCDYENGKDKYIALFYFLDAEKIMRFHAFVKEQNRNIAYIICRKELEMQLRKYLPTVNYCAIDLEPYTVKKIRYYD